MASPAASETIPAGAMGVASDGLSESRRIRILMVEQHDEDRGATACRIDRSRFSSDRDVVQAERISLVAGCERDILLAD